MKPLDLSFIDELSYRGCKTEADRAARDDLKDKGFTILQDEKTPFDEPPAADQTAQPQKPMQPEPPADCPPGMASLWKLAQDFQKRHTPPQNTAEYWDALTDDMLATAEKGNNEPFLMDMLTTIYSYFEKQIGNA